MNLLCFQQCSLKTQMGAISVSLEFRQWLHIFISKSLVTQKVFSQRATFLQRDLIFSRRCSLYSKMLPCHLVTVPCSQIQISEATYNGIKGILRIINKI